MNDKQSERIDHLTTEARNPASAHVDTMSSLEIVRLINEQDAGIAAAVAEQAEPIAAAIDVIADRFRRGGRLLLSRRRHFRPTRRA